MNTTKGIYAVLAMLTVWCTWNSSNIGGLKSDVNTISSNQQIMDRIVADLVDQLHQEQREEEEITPESTFNEVFKEMRSQYGSGHIFIWNDKEYTTDYAEEIHEFSATLDSSGQWVLNSRDLDDFCRSNYHDECGICDGSGALTWYLDRDGDGLGDPSRIQLSCNEPIASK